MSLFIYLWFKSETTISFYISDLNSCVIPFEYWCTLISSISCMLLLHKGSLGLISILKFNINSNSFSPLSHKLLESDHSSKKMHERKYSWNSNEICNQGKISIVQFMHSIRREFIEIAFWNISLKLSVKFDGGLEFVITATSKFYYHFIMYFLLKEFFFFWSILILNVWQNFSLKFHCIQFLIF